MTTSPTDDFITRHGAGWRAGFLAGVRAASRRAGEGGDSNAPVSPLLGRLLDEWPDLFEAEVLPRMDPTTRAVLAQVARAGRDAVRLPPDLACAGRTVGVRLKLAEFVGSAGRLAWAKANGCPWEARTCELVVAGYNIETTCTSAAFDGHLQVVEWLIAAGADFDIVRPSDGITPLFVAAQEGHLDVVGRLIAAGAVLNKARSNTGGTALFIAAQNGHLDVVIRLIVAARVDINKGCSNGDTSLSIALARGHADVAQKLRAAGANEPHG